jgi:23S rRNA (uracil1939-C5)-methyltransferase
MAQTVTIEKLVYGGEGLARDEGRVVLAPFVLPGERVEVERIDNLHARLIRIDQASPVRVDPPCPYFGRCGGCDYQHAPYAYQLEQKVAILREVLQRIGKFPAPEQIEVISGPEWEYRNRVQLHHDNGRIGYLAAGSHRLIDIAHCPISSPRINEEIAKLRARRLPRSVRTVELFTNENDTGVLDYPAAGYSFRVSPGSFFQVNRFLIDALVNAVVTGASTAVDLYAGVGLFSLPLAASCDRVTAVESSASAVADLEFNAKRAEAAVNIVKSDVDEYIANLEAAPELLVADPPRAGIGKVVTRHLVRLKPARIHIVACDPATLARDLAVLLAGGYRIDRMLLVDLFPQTYHMETVVHLSAS